MHLNNIKWDFLIKALELKRQKTNDSNLEDVERFSIQGNDVNQKIKKLSTTIELLVSGLKEEVSKIKKHILLLALRNEADIKLESEKAFKPQFESTETTFTSITQHFEVKNGCN